MSVRQGFSTRNSGRWPNDYYAVLDLADTVIAQADREETLLSIIDMHLRGCLPAPANGKWWWTHPTAPRPVEMRAAQAQFFADRNQAVEPESASKACGHPALSLSTFCVLPANHPGKCGLIDWPNQEAQT